MITITFNANLCLRWKSNYDYYYYYY